MASLNGNNEIMIVDDNEGNVKLLVEMLTAEGYTVRPATSAALAFRSIQARPPALILLDVRMPDMDGFEVCRRLKADEKTRSIPVIFITILENAQDKIKGFELGAVDYITKPFSEAEVLARVRTHLELRRYHEHLEELVKERTAELQREIDERKRTESALQENEEKYRLLAETSNTLISEIDANGRFLYVNPKHKEVLGYEADEMIGHFAFEFGNPAEERKAKERLEKSLGEEQVQSNEWLFKDKSGSWKRFVCHSNTYVDSKGETHITVYSFDITRRKQMEEALRESEQTLRMIFETMSEGIALNENVYNEQGEMVDYRILNVNQAFYSTADYRGGNALGRLATDLYGMSSETIKEFWKQHKAKNATAYVEFLSPIRNRWFFIATSPFINGRFVTSFFDITERKRTEEALRKSEAYLRGVFEHSPDMVYTLDVATRKRDFLSRDSFCGYSRSELEQPNSVLYAVHPDDLSVLQENWRQASAGLLASSIEFRLRDKDGKWEWIHQRVSLLSVNADGTPKEIMVLLSIITERKRAEERLRTSESSLREAQRLTHVGDWQWDVATDTVKWSEELYRINGRDPNLPPPSYAEMPACYTSESWQRLSAAVTEAVQNGTAYELDLDLIRFDGVIRHTFSRGEADFDSDGKVIGLHGTVQDITERKLMEEKLRESEWRGRIISELMADTVYVADVEAGGIVKIRWVSGNMFRITEQTIEEIGTSDFWGDLVYPDDKTEFLSFMQNILVTAQAGEMECRVFHKQGGIRWVQLFAQPQIGAENRVTTIVGAIKDITTRKQAEEEIRQLNTTLEQRVEERTQELRDAQEKLIRHEKLAVLGQMAGSVGHELRNPLGVISSALYFLKMVLPDADEKVKEYLALIQKQVHISDKIVSDLLDFTRIKSVDREPLSVSEVIQQTLARFPAPDNVQVIFDLPEDLPKAYADLQHVLQVLGNLTLNACQAMKDGGRLTFSASAADEMIRIAVQDTGTGITPDNMKKLFEPLFTTKPKGIGLGLAVSRKLIEANGGRIEVQSEIGAGSTFTVWLPVCSSM